jgi:signal transduction histidine kinase
MAVSQRARTRPVPRGKSRYLGRLMHASSLASSSELLRTRVRPPASPGQIAVIFRWGAWLLALGLIATGSTATYGQDWWQHRDVFLLLGLTLAVNVLLTVGLQPYMRLMRRFPPVLALDVLFCLGVYYQSNIWTSPFQFYSYASLMLPVTLFFFSGALAGSLLFFAVNVALLYGARYTFAWAQASGVADTYLMQLAIVPLLAFVFAYPNRLYAQLRSAQQRLSLVERERLVAAERTRIAQSLHDSVAQMLFGIGMLAESALARVTDPGQIDRVLTDPAASAPTYDNIAQEQVEERVSLAIALRQVRDLATRGNHEMRRAIYALNEPGVSRRGLAVSLRAMLADLGARTGVDTHVVVGAVASLDDGAGIADNARPPGGDAWPDADVPPGPPDDGAPGQAPEPEEIVVASKGNDAAASMEPAQVPEAVAEALYSVAREALANVEKHAEAMNVWVELYVERPPATASVRQVTLRVRDDGCGFRRPLLARPGEPDEDELGHVHFGLGNMRRAVEALGGRLELSTAPGRGTTIVASVPVS